MRATTTLSTWRPDSGWSWLTPGSSSPTATRSKARRSGPGEHRDLSAEVGKELSRLTGPERESLTVDDFLARIDRHPEAMAILRSRLEGSAAIPLDRVGVEELEGSFGIGSGRTFRIAGGNQQLAGSLAAGIDDVRLSTPVAEVHHSASGVQLVDHGGDRHNADAAIIAVPLPSLRRLQFDPQLPVALAATIDAIEMGTAAKLVQPVSGHPALSARQSTELPVWFWTSGAAESVLSSFAGTAEAVQRLMVGDEWMRLSNTGSARSRCDQRSADRRLGTRRNGRWAATPAWVPVSEDCSATSISHRLGSSLRVSMSTDQERSKERFKAGSRGDTPPSLPLD